MPGAGGPGAAQKLWAQRRSRQSRVQPSCICKKIMQESRESESPVTGGMVTEDLVR